MPEKIGEGLEDMKLDTFLRREGTTVMMGSKAVDGPRITDLTLGAIAIAICTALGTGGTRVDVITSSTTFSTSVPTFSAA